MNKLEPEYSTINKNFSFTGQKSCNTFFVYVKLDYFFNNKCFIGYIKTKIMWENSI